MPRKASLLTVLALGAAVGLLPDPSPFGLTDAAAASRTYTRKRVNGRWITGRFRSNVPVRQRYASLPAAPAEPDEHPLPPARPGSGDRHSLADRVIATASIILVPGEPRLETMRPALEARARMLAGETFALPLPDPPPPLAEPLTSR